MEHDRLTDKTDDTDGSDEGLTNDELTDARLRADGLDPDSVPDITDPKQWRTIPKEGGAA
ncbi:MAG: hypothetical protein NVS2B8_00320 [Vulcanimicrobiaceae bacterium]